MESNCNNNKNYPVSTYEEDIYENYEQKKMFSYIILSFGKSTAVGIKTEKAKQQITVGNLESDNYPYINFWLKQYFRLMGNKLTIIRCTPMKLLAFLYQRSVWSGI